MSLKTFHLLFVSTAIAMALGCGIWTIRDYIVSSAPASELVFGLGCLGAALALGAYERYFLKKTRRLDY